MNKRLHDSTLEEIIDEFAIAKFKKNIELCK